MRRPFVCSLLIGLIIFFVFRAANPATVSAATIHHYEYVFTAGFIYVYDIDNGFKLLKTVAVPTSAGMRGAVASAATGMLYLSYGSDGDTGGFQLAYNLSTDKVVWTMSYGHGIDSQSISPDGKKIYMPAGELASGGTWYVEDSSNGIDLATISTGGSGPHNTIVSPNGARVYMGNRDFTGSAGTNDFAIADTATNRVVGGVTPLKSGARPFTINSKETLSFNTVTGFLGFQVGDLSAGKAIYTIAVDGSKIPGFTTQTPATIPSHGISLSPDDKELYLIDQPNSYVHVFDVSGLPASAPVQVADIKLFNTISGNEVGCAYDCLKDGWMQHNRDGRFVYVGDSGDVIDTLTRKTIATLPEMANSRQEIEIDFQDSTPIWAATSRSGIGYANPLPPTFTTRITSPDLGSTASGTTVTVSASVFDSASISAVDLYKDGVLYASTTTSPYAFSWDTTKDTNGSHRLMVTANDTLGNSTSFLATFTVNNVNIPNPPSITTSSLPNGTQNAAYSATVAVTGGTTPYTWSIVSGALPAGLALGSSTGAISGAPTGTGTSNFTVQVTDANSLTATKSLSLTVNASPSITITTSSLASGTQNAAYSATLAVTGGTTPYTWSIVSGALPAGLGLGSRTGAISGTPTGTGTSNFTAQVTDTNSLTATKSLSLTVNASPSITITIATASLANGTQNAAYSATLAATGGTSPYIWTIVSGALPAGLGLGSSTGAISGTPTGTGANNFTVRVTDANALTATKSLSLTVNAPPSITITTTSLPSGTQNAAYSATLAATGGTTPYTWSIVSGALPAGLALRSSTGAISGTPTGTGANNFTVRVTDANSLTATKSLSLNVNASPSITITTSSLASGAQNAAYSATLAATGGPTPYTWSIVSGSLPAGLALGSSTGAISGTPAGTGTSNFTVQVTDANSLTATKSLNLTVNASPSITITTTSLPSGTQNAAYSATLAATGGTTPYTWAIVFGSLPAGLGLGSSTGAISGTPAGTGTSNFTVRVTDANSLTATKSLSLTVSASPSITITTTSLPNGTQNAAYSATLAATGGTTPYTWSIVSGSLPAGLGLGSSTGAISGTPAGTGTSNFAVRVTDANSLIATKSLSLTVIASPSITITATSGTPQSATIGMVFGATLKVTVRDSGGNPQAGLTVTFTAPAQTGASGTFAGGMNTAITNASGVATSAVFTANSIAGGPYNVSASVAGAATPANFSLTNNPGPSPSVTATSGISQSSIVNTLFPAALKATVKDASSKPVPGVSVTFAAPSGGPSGTFSSGGVSSTVTTDASGIATAPTFTANGTGGGPYNVTASATGAATSAAFSLNNVDFTLGQSVPGSVQVTAGTPKNVTLTMTTTPAGSVFPADVNLSCAASGLPLSRTCVLNPAKISVNSPSGSATTLTITAAASLPPGHKRQDPLTPYLPWSTATALAGLLAIFFAARQKIVPLRAHMAYLTLALLVISSAGLMGCVGLAATQKGPSSVTVTATSGGVSRTTTVNIIIK